VSSPATSSISTESALPVGRALLLAGAAITAVSSVMTWFWGGQPGDVQYETALQGEESLFAVLGGLAGGVVGLIAAVKKSRSAALALTGLACGIASVVLAWLFIDYNSQPVIVRGQTIPTGIGTGAYVGLAGGLLMSLGGIIEAVRALKR
jgi:hypothetical protein